MQLYLNLQYVFMAYTETTLLSIVQGPTILVSGRQCQSSESGVVRLGHFASFKEFFILIQFKMNFKTNRSCTSLVSYTSVKISL